MYTKDLTQMTELTLKNNAGGWHAEPTTLTMRHFPGNPLEYYSKHLPYDACAQVQLLANKTAFIHTALVAVGVELSLKDWARMGKLLKDNYGVETILCDRDGEIKTWDIGKRWESLKDEKS